jgi:hypothetical protein
MATLKTSSYRNSSILRINFEQELINTSPEYQRPGGIWSLSKRQLLIDSILNDYDIPKLYFHQINDEDEYEYSIIDGRQRLEAIWDFIDGKYTLAEDFEYFEDDTVKAGNLSYLDLGKEYPKLKINFDSYTLPIVIVETEDIDLIEDMFSRLNEAVPLNAAEKRNAFGGSMAKAIREISFEDFFTNRVRFGNTRYQHREVSARLLFLLYSLNFNGRILDTKKPYLDKMTLFYKNNPDESPEQFEDETLDVLNKMNAIFTEKDNLLRSQSAITIYFLIFRNAIKNNQVNFISRKKLFEFYDAVAKNRKVAEEDITNANYEFLEFERLSQQGTNDSYSIRQRVKIISDFIGVKE